MAITVKCRICQTKHQVRDGLAGTMVVCKKCGDQIAVPRPRSPGAARAEDVPSDGYRVKDTADRALRSVAPQMPRAVSSERTLARGVVVGEYHDAPLSGNRQRLVIFGGAAVCVVVVVALLVSSVGPPAGPADEGESAKPMPGNPRALAAPVAARPAARQPVAPRASRKKEEIDDSQHFAGPITASPPLGEPPPAPRESSSPRQSDIVIDSGNGNWEVTVDPPAEPVGVDPKKRIFATIPKNSTGEILYPDCPATVVALGSNNNPREIREVRDVQANRRLGAIRSALLINARTALCPNGLLFAAWSFGQNQIGIWDVKAERPRGVLLAGINTIPRLLMFAGNDRLVAAGKTHELLVWRMPAGFLERSIPLPKVSGELAAGLSPGGRFLALAADDGSTLSIRIFDLAIGNVAGEIGVAGIDGDDADCRAVAFSPDGAELATLYESSSESNLFVFRVANGKLSRHIRLPGRLQATFDAEGMKTGRVLDWFPSKKRWLVYGQGIIDRAAGKIVWKAHGGRPVVMIVRRMLDNDRWLTLGVEKNDAALVAEQLPVDEFE